VSFEQTEAIVLRKVDFSETSRIVTFLTPYRGRMACMVKGARRKGSPLAALLDTYNHLEVTYAHKENRNIQILTEAVLLNGFGAIKASVEHIACAAFLLEMAGTAAQENAPAPELFQALRNCLERLNLKNENPFTTLVQNILLVLEAAGVAPDFNDKQLMDYIPRIPKSRQTDIQDSLIVLAAGQSPGQSCDIPLIMQFLNAYSEHHFERSIKSYPFLRSLLESAPIDI